MTRATHSPRKATPPLRRAHGTVPLDSSHGPKCRITSAGVGAGGALFGSDGAWVEVFEF